MSTWATTILTLFPEMFPGPLDASLAGAARAKGIWSLETRDIRGHATDPHRSVDDSPFGGGPGMIMRADVVDAALADLPDDGRPRLYLSPRGRVLNQAMVHDIAVGDGVVLLCGRYEGLDERVIQSNGLDEVSLGDFVLSGGEPAAIALIDACVRLLPGVMGAQDSHAEESFESGLLEYPHYTRPAEWRGRTVPDVLLSGHHERIQRWRMDQARRITRERRVDLWARYVAGLNETRVSQ